jgi:hypothetical protein
MNEFERYAQDIVYPPINLDAIKDDIDQLSPYWASGYEPDELSVLEAVRSAMIAREEFFYTQVCEAIISCIANIHPSSDKPLVLLFDIDETIGRNIKKPSDSGQPESALVLRPALKYLLSWINEVKLQYPLRVGLLSSRNKLGMDQSFSDPDILLPIADSIDKSLVISTEQQLGSTLSNTAASNLLSPSSSKNEESDSLMNLDYSDYGDKLNTLNEIASQTAHSSIIVVDDLPYPAALDKARGYYGVPLESNGSFYLKS